MADLGPSPGLINALTNPPNPAVTAGQTAQGVNALLQLQADMAARDAYQQSVDPVTGQFDSGKFNAILSQSRGGAFNLGKAMQQAGQGQSAEGVGVQQDLQGKLDQLGAQGLYLQPLVAKAANGQVTAQDVKDMLASMPPGLVPDRVRQQVENLTDAQASNWVMGAAFANDNARDMLRARAQQFGGISMGGYYQPTQTNPYAAGGAVYPQGPTPFTMSPEGATRANIDLNTPVPDGYDMPDGSHKYGTLGDAMKDYGVPFERLYVNPQTGAVSGPNMPTLQMGQGAIRAPASGPAPAAPTAPSGGAGGGGAPRVAPAPAAPSRAPAPAAAPPASTPQPPPAPAPAPVPQAGGAPPSSARGGGSAGLSPQETQRGRDAYTAAQAEQPAIQGRIATVDLALDALSRAKVGGGTETLQEIQNVLGSYSPEWIKKIIPDYDPVKAASDRQTAVKYMQQLTNAGGGLPGGASTSDKLNAAAAATPNAHMQDQASEHVLRVIKAQNQIQQYVMSEFEKTGKPAAQYQKFQADWARTHDPRAFFPLTQDMLDYMRKNVTGKEKETFNDTVHELVTNKVIPDPRKQPGVTE